MFGRSMFGGFENDPFFADFREQQRQMSAVFNDFGVPSLFQDDPFHAITNGGNTIGIPQRRGQLALPRMGGAMAMQPFGMFDMYHNMNSMMMNMQQNFHQMATNPNTHTFSQSSVTTFNNGEVYHASSSTRTAPGGIKETRNSVRDSQSGVEKMSIGHHIHERGHIMGKSRNRRTGEQEENQEFLNIDEDEAHTFDQEWREKTGHFHSNSRHAAIRSSPYNRHHRPAITSGTRDYRHERDRASRQEHHRDRSVRQQDVRRIPRTETTTQETAATETDTVTETVKETETETRKTESDQDSSEEEDLDV